jgi:hypothetical protein
MVKQTAQMKGKAQGGDYVSATVVSDGSTRSKEEGGLNDDQNWH